MAATKTPSTMAAWQYTTASSGLENTLTLNPTATIPPSADPSSSGQTLVRVLACALNPVDFKIPELPIAGQLMIKRPATPGLDFCGRVVQSGRPDLEVGQLVFGRLDGLTRFGSLAQYTVTPAEGTVAVPAGGVISVEDAACIGTAALTAYQCIVPNVKAGAGERVFINGGSGGTGVWGIQIAKAVGCHVTTSCSATNVPLCSSLGADEVIDYTASDIVARLMEKGLEFALIVDNVGSSRTLYNQCHHFLGKGGKYVQVGAPVSVGGVMGMVERNMRPAWLGGGKRSWEFLNVKNKMADFQQIAQWMVDGKLKAVKDETFAFAQAKEAFAKLKTGRAKGKIVVKIGDDA